MQNLSPANQLKLIVNEVFSKRRGVAISFMIISFIVLGIGLVWPKKYLSSTTLLWNRANIIQPLLQGTAVTTTLKEQAETAKEVIYSNKNLDILIDKAELYVKQDGSKMSLREIEILKSELRKKIIIGRSGDKVIRISFTDKNPETAYLVVSIISNLFIEESSQSKKTGSQDAYNFIEKQVEEYQSKLESIKKRIDDFKEQNIELQVDSTQEVNSRVNQLRQSLVRDKSQLSESIIQMESLEEQMLEESRNTSVIAKENLNQQRLRALEDQLNTLRLSYTDTYPDIIQLKEQISTLKKNIEIQQNMATETGDENVSNRVSSPLYQRLKQQHSTLVTTIRTVKSRIKENEELLKRELDRSTEVNVVISRLEELSRDYDVTKNIYDDLLRRRENARVSLNLEMENAGSLFKIQEPPIVPLVPTGLRFLHFTFGSILLGGGIPIGIIVVLLFIDPRIRHEDYFTEDDYPVLAVISRYQVESDKRIERNKTVQSIAIIVFSGFVLITLALSRYFEVI